MTICKQKGVHWAILSDNYGIFFPSDRRAYYEKPPASVTPEEELAIISQFEQTLSPYDEIWFYVRTETFHTFYERVLKMSAIASRVHLFEALQEIV